MVIAASSVLNRILSYSGSISPHFHTEFPRLYSSCNQYVVKVGIPEFLKGVGKGVESHIPKLEAEIGDFHKLLVTRTLRLKKLGIPCKHRKLILKFTHKYRLGLWRPRTEFKAKVTHIFEDLMKDHYRTRRNRSILNGLPPQ